MCFCRSCVCTFALFEGRFHSVGQTIFFLTTDDSLWTIGLELERYPPKPEKTIVGILTSPWIHSKAQILTLAISIAHLFPATISQLGNCPCCSTLEWLSVFDFWPWVIKVSSRMYSRYFTSHDVGAAVHHCRIHVASLRRNCPDGEHAWQKWHWLSLTFGLQG